MSVLEEALTLPTHEKLRLMEALWSTLTANEESVPSPDWHRLALEQTQRDIDAGIEEEIDWNLAKKQLRS